MAQKRDARHTLMLPFEQGLLRFPNDGERYCFINAAVPEGDDWRTVLDCEQGNRQAFLQLEASGFCVEPILGLNDFDGALVLAGKHKRLNEANVVRAWNGLKPGSLLVVAGDKNVGIASLRKFVQAKAEIEDSLSKNHGLVFWVVKKDADWEIQSAGAGLVGYKTAPGMFSPEKIDLGSSLLADHFDERIRGSVADFGAGWGYLSGELLSRSNKLSHLDLYEIDWASLEAAKENIGANVGDVRMNAYWQDITSEPITRKYSWIIMNPPFHAGRKADIPLGEGFISKARQSLQPKGKLLMVANMQLPYEALLKQKFSRCDLLMAKDGFKIFEATA